MRKSDYIAIGKGLAAWDFENKSHNRAALGHIFESLHSGEQGQNQVGRFEDQTAMTDAYNEEIDRLHDAKKSPLERAREANNNFIKTFEVFNR